jgi:NADPH:quinone reductase-like Zn-dependent oxidoreductase
MKIFLAGATGVLGRRLVPLLVGRGHEVTGLTRAPAKRALLEQLGAWPVVADALDAEAVGRAISEAEPDVVVHQLTDLSELKSVRNFRRSFAGNARLRSTGTDIRSTWYSMLLSADPSIVFMIRLIPRGQIRHMRIYRKTGGLNSRVSGRGVTCV